MRRRIRFTKKTITPDENYARVNNILSADKLPMSPECQRVALQEIKRALGEYFDVEDLTMDVREDGRIFDVTIHFSAFRVKSFHILKN